MNICMDFCNIPNKFDANKNHPCKSSWIEEDNSSESGKSIQLPSDSSVGKVLVEQV